MKTVARIRFHLLVLTLNQENVFSKPHPLLCDVIMLSIFLENVALKAPHQKLSFTSVSITLFWAQSKKTGFRGSGDDIMTSQVPRPKVQLDPNSFLISDTYKTIISSQTFLRKNAKKFEIVTCLQVAEKREQVKWYLLIKDTHREKPP